MRKSSLGLITLLVIVGLAGYAVSSMVAGPSTSVTELSQKLESLEEQVTKLEESIAPILAPASQTAESPVATRKTAVVSVDKLNVRQAPNVGATRVAVLKKGEIVDVIAKSGEWTQIQFQGRTGWVSSQYLEEKSATK